jgi:hypothetical protein
MSKNTMKVTLATNGDITFGKNDDTNIVTFKDKVIAKGYFDFYADGWYLSAKNVETFFSGSAQEVADLFAGAK